MSANYGTHDWLKDWCKTDNQKLLDKMKKKTKTQEEERQILFNKLKEELIEIACAEGYDTVETDFERRIVLPNGAPIACMYSRGINFYMDALLYYRDEKFNWITTMQRTYIDWSLCTSAYAAAGEVGNEITLKRKNEEADKLVDIMLVNGGVLNIPHTTKALFMHPAFGKTHMIGHMDVHTSSIYTFTEWCKVIKKRFKKACPVVIRRYKEILKTVKKDEVKTAGAAYDA